MSFIYFDFKSFFRFMYLVFFRAKSIGCPMSPRRAVGFAIYFLVFPLFEMFTAICLLLDHVFFPGFRRTKLEKPLFIVGHPRSGTSYLQGLIAKDDEQFFSFRMVDAVFPSVLQKKAIAWIGRLDRKLGGPLMALILRRQARMFGKYANIHDVGLFSLAEDDRLLMHAVSVPLALLMTMNAPEFDWLFHFDEKARAKDRDRIMNFFRACLQRQAYFKGGNRILLGKAPAGSLRVKTLRQYFPDCRLIYTLRNPLSAVPSALDLGLKYFEAIGATELWPQQQARFYPFVRETFLYPLACLRDADPATCEVIVHEKMMRHLREVICAFYEKFGYRLSPQFDEILRPEDEKQRNFVSRHKTSLEQFNLTREQILADFKEVFDHYKFES